MLWIFKNALHQNRLIFQFHFSLKVLKDPFSMILVCAVCVCYIFLSQKGMPLPCPFQSRNILENVNSNLISKSEFRQVLHILISIFLHT